MPFPKFNTVSKTHSQVPYDELNLRPITNNIQFFITVLLLGSIFCFFFFFCWNEEWKGLDIETLANKLWPVLSLRTVLVFSEKIGKGDQPHCLCPSCRILVCTTMYIKFTLGLQQCLTGYLVQMLEWPMILKANVAIKDSHQPSAWCLVLVVSG